MHNNSHILQLGISSVKFICRILIVGRVRSMNELTKAMQLLENNDTENALSILKQSLDHATDDEKFTIADIYMQWGFYEEALSVLSPLIHIYPEESELLMMLAQLYTEMNQDDNALELLHRISPGDDAYVPALLQLADLYQAQGLYEVAEQKLSEARNLAPDEEIIDFALAELLFSIADYGRAITYYLKVQSPKIADVTIIDRLAESYAAIGQYEKALDCFLQIDSEDPALLFKFGLTASRAGRNDLAIKAWEKTIEIDPYYYAVYYHLAKVYDEEEWVQEAYQTAKAGIDHNEYNKELYYLAGTLLFKLDNPHEGEEYIRRAIDLDPDYKEAILFLIQIFKDKENHDAVIELIQDMKLTGSDDSIYDWELARAYNELEDYAEAAKYYQEAYVVLDKDSDFLKEYGYFLIEDGKKEDGLALLKAYLQIIPEDAETLEYVERMDA